jgi:type IV secretory pathway VirJ component
MRIFLITFFILSSFFSKAQDVSSLPLTAFPTATQDADKPLIVYVSGDGGLNSFSKQFCQALNSKGYPVVLFNSLKYFWSKKTAQQTSADVQRTLLYYKNVWKKNKVVVIGYSFGGDVLPFVYTRWPKDVQSFVRNLVMVSPSNTTDFEVHVNQMFGKKQTDGVSVIDEINKITDKPLLFIQAEREPERVETEKLKVRNQKLVILKGGHHYDNNGGEVANVIVQNL